MRNYRTEAIILKRRNVGEADRILTIFTKTSGKIRIKAIGVRKTTSRRSAHIEPFNYSLLTLYKGQGFPILTEAITIKNYSLIKNNLIKVGFAYHLCELVDGLCAENQENRNVFDLLQNAISRLSSNENIAVIVHEFEISLLSLLGFWNSARPLAYESVDAFVENILERRLKSKKFLAKLQ